MLGLQQQLGQQLELGHQGQEDELGEGRILYIVTTEEGKGVC